MARRAFIHAGFKRPSRARAETGETGKKRIGKNHPPQTWGLPAKNV